jgi:hypothetical protein
VAAANARNTSTRHAARTCELTAGPTADARHAALPARTATGAAVLPAGTAVAVGVTATATWIQLVDNVSGHATRGATCIGLCCRHRHHSNRCSNSPTNKQRFHEIEFL